MPSLREHPIPFMSPLLEGLKRHTTIVADTGELAAIERLRPRDATTNPSLILKAAQKAEYRPLVADAIQSSAGDSLERRLDHVLVAFGTRILELIPGRVSTEVDARLSFDTRATIEKARRLIELYERRGVEPARVLIKIAATWEGVRAAECARARRYPLQHHAALLGRAGDRRGAGWCNADLAVRRPDLRLASQRRRAAHGTSRPWLAQTIPAYARCGRSTRG